MDEIDIFIFYIAFVALVGFLAHRQGRSVWIAVILSLLFIPLIVMIGYLIAGKTDLKKAQEKAEIARLEKEFNR